MWSSFLPEFLAYKLTWANFTKKWLGVSQNHEKHYFDLKNQKFDKKKNLSTLLYENLQLCNLPSFSEELWQN